MGCRSRISCEGMGAFGSRLIATRICCRYLLYHLRVPCVRPSWREWSGQRYGAWNSIEKGKCRTSGAWNRCWLGIKIDQSRRDQRLYLPVRNLCYRWICRLQAWYRHSCSGWHLRRQAGNRFAGRHCYQRMDSVVVVVVVVLRKLHLDLELYLARHYLQLAASFLSKSFGSAR